MKILGLNGIIGGWCRYYQICSSPSYYFEKLEYESFWGMAHWLGRKRQMSIKKVMKSYRQGNTLGTGRTTLYKASDFKAKRHRLRAITNPYTSEATTVQWENLDSLEEEWIGAEERKGQGDRKEVMYQRDQGRCGICGNFVPWEEAHLDHRTPRHLFSPPESGDTLGNQWILHREPCHQMKTKRDLQGGGRVR
jgi:5-methylcytosine-specific restriction endonuclease McrA